jgi:RNA polymerase sigma-70 factor (ECF subfamily)
MTTETQTRKLKAPPKRGGDHSTALQRAGNAAPESVTLLLSRMGRGDRGAFDRLVPLVYQELHRIAEAYLRRELNNHTLQPTALINEAYLRLAIRGAPDYENRTHFYAVAARVMRQILVDHARSRRAAKRGSELKVALDERFDFAPERDRIVIALDDALEVLAGEDDRKARLVEMRFFAGMTAEEIAECLGTQVHIVRRELRVAQAWLRREMEG